MEKILKIGWPVVLGVSVQKRVENLFGSSLVAYWPMQDSTTTIEDVSGNGFHGTYTGVDLQNAAGPVGGLVPYWDGVNDYGNIYSAELAAAFNATAGSVLHHSKVSEAGDWSDSVYRRVTNLEVNSSNRVYSGKFNAANYFYSDYGAGGTHIYPGRTTTTLPWFSWAMTWDKTADEVKGFYNGAQIMSTFNSLGTWAGSLGATTTAIGSLYGTSCVYGWKGWLAEIILLNRAATPGEVAQVAGWR